MDSKAVFSANDKTPTRGRLIAIVVLAAAVTAFMVISTMTAPLRAFAADVATIPLGTASQFSVLGGQSVTNTGPTTLEGDLGVSPGSSITGFPPGNVGGATHNSDAVADTAQQNLTTAYNNAKNRPSNFTLTGQNLGGKTLIGGVYTFSTSAQLTGTLTLNAEGDPNKVFIFQIGSTLTTASASSINLIGGAQACNVFFQVGSSATLGTGTDFVGNILALTSITANTGATIDGRLLAQNGSVTLDSNVITTSACTTATSTPTATSTTSVTTSPTSTSTASVTSSATGTSTASVTSSATGTSTASVTSSATSTSKASVTSSASGTPTGSNSASATGGASGSAKESQTATESATTGAGGANGSSGGGNLANTGSSGPTSLLGVGGALVVLMGGVLLAIARIGSRPKRRH